MVPTFTCGLSRSNFSFATLSSLLSKRTLRAFCGASAAQGSSAPKGPETFLLCARRHRLPRPALDHLVGDRRRNLLVAVELHRVARAPLRVGAQVGRVAEHLRQRDAGPDRERVAARLLALDPPAATREVADHVAQELLRGDHLDRHDRLEQDGLRALGRLLEGERPRDLEGDLRRVGLVVLAVGDGDAHVDHGVAGLDAGLERLLDPLLNGGDELRGDRAALDLVDEVEALPGRRFEIDVDNAVLARAAGLADELALDLLRGALDGLR